jgi:hypothetical protein
MSMTAVVFRTGTKETSFTHSISMCRMRRFLAVLRSFFHSSPLNTFSCYSSPPTILPSSLASSCHYFLVYLLFLLISNSYTMLFWEFYFLTFCTCPNQCHLFSLVWVMAGFLTLHEFLY